MVFKDAYEVLDYMAQKSGMFKMVQAEMVAQKEELSAKQEQIDDLTVQLGDLMLGGM